MFVTKLANSSCCGNVVRLSDLSGKQIEFRQFENRAPQIGAKWTCPSCEIDYFVYWVREERFWNYPEESKQETFLSPKGFPYKNDFKDCFVAMGEDGIYDTGFYTFVLTYYHPLVDDPNWKVCINESKTQLVRYYPDWPPDF